jgi:hypothetical protein
MVGTLDFRCEIGDLMLEIRKTAVFFDEEELLELERIIIDRDKEAAIGYLKKSVYDKIVKSQQGRLKSHLDTGGNPVESFKAATGK